MNTIRQELERLHAEHGHLTAEIVLESARDEASPLHGQFEWDDSVAAERHRLHTAGEIIRRVKVRRIVADDKPPVKVRAYVSVPAEGDERPVFRATTEITEAEKARVLQAMRLEVSSLIARYHNHAEFWEVLSTALTTRAAA